MMSENNENPGSEEPKTEVETTPKEDSGSLNLKGEASKEDAGTLNLDKPKEPAPVEWKEVSADDITKLFPTKVTVGKDEHDYKASKEEVSGIVDLANALKADPQKLIDYHVAGQVKGAVESQRVWGEQLASWQKEVMAHPTLGGAMWPQTRESVIGLIDRFGDDNFKEFLAHSGGQQYLPVIEFLHKVASVIPAEGSPASGKGNDSNVKPLADRLFATQGG